MKTLRSIHRLSDPGTHVHPRNGCRPRGGPGLAVAALAIAVCLAATAAPAQVPPMRGLDNVPHDRVELRGGY